MGAIVFALILAYFITRAIDAGKEQARTEVRRLREEVTRNVREARETAGRAGRSRAARTAARAAAGVWRGMQGARLGAGPRARHLAARTGPLRRILRAAWEGGRLGVREGHASRAARGFWSFWPPRIGMCGECGFPATIGALSQNPFGDGLICRGCLDERLRSTPQGLNPGVSSVWDAELVPDPSPATPSAPATDDADTGDSPVPDVGTQAPAQRTGEVAAAAAVEADVLPPVQPGGAVTVGAPEPAPVPEAGPDTETSPITAAAPAAVPLAGHPAITTGEHMAGTEIALPAGIGGTVSVAGGVTGGGGGGDSRTHGLWLTAVARQAAYVEAVKQHLNGMAAKLYSVEGGRTQIRDIYAWHKESDAFIGQLGDMVAAIDPGEQQFIAAIPGGDTDEMCAPHYYRTGGRR